MSDKISELQFGQTVRNVYASDGNPNRDGIFVRWIHRSGRMNPGKWAQLTDGKGRFWESLPEALIFLAQGIEVSTTEPSSARSTSESPTPLGDAPQADRERSVGLSEEEIERMVNSFTKTTQAWATPCQEPLNEHEREIATNVLRYGRDHFSKLSGEQVEKIMDIVNQDWLSVKEVRQRLTNLVL